MAKGDSRYTKPGSRRRLLPQEKALLRAMLANQYPNLDFVLDTSEVDEMLDGGMGSIRFVDKNTHERHLGKVLREAEFLDTDGILVSIGINSDQRGRLFEVDFWKVDFSPLRKYPSVADLTMLGD
ncbi:MAG TPA: hypothetical protein VF126_10215 [Acidobacteriaceae bacterium]